MRDDIDYLLRYYQDHVDDLDIKISELEAFYLYVKDPANKPLWVKERLKREKRRYLQRGIPEEMMPKALQGISNDEPVWKPLKEREEPLPSVMQEEDVQIKSPVKIEPRKKAEPKRKVDDPFSSDGFGTLQGEPSTPRGLGNRRVR